MLRGGRMQVQRPSQDTHPVEDNGPPPEYREHPGYGPHVHPWVPPPRTPWPGMVVNPDERPIIITPSVTLGGQNRFAEEAERNMAQDRGMLTVYSRHFQNTTAPGK